MIAGLLDQDADDRPADFASFGMPLDLIADLEPLSH